MSAHEWQAGEEVIVVSYGNWNLSAYTDVIERLTKTQIVTANRGKYSRRDGYIVGTNANAQLYPATDESARKSLREYRLSVAAAAVYTQANEFRKDPNLSTAQAVRQAVDYWEFTRGPE